MTNQHGYILHVLQSYLVHGNTIRFFEIKMTRKKCTLFSFYFFIVLFINIFQILWLKDLTPIANSTAFFNKDDRYSFKNRYLRDSHLMINSLKKTDEGRYKCELLNGSVISDYMLKLKGKIIYSPGIKTIYWVFSRVSNLILLTLYVSIIHQV